MKKLMLFLSLMAGMFTAQAEDYPYLTFETTDGAKVSMEASSLSITISGTTLMAGSQSFTLSNLSKMYFSTANETTWIHSIDNERLTTDNDNEIYDLQGHKVSKEQMRSGQVYIVKTKHGTHKLTVR